MSFSDRINNIQESKSVKLSALVAELKAEGREIISLNVGEPDFNTPAPIIEGTIQALNNNETRYSLVKGLSSLREKIAENFNNTYSAKVNSENILLGNGSKHLIYSILQTLCNPGDEVIIPAPYWVTFPESVKLAGGIPKIVATKANHQLDFSAIENALTKKTKAIIINSPNNPTGAVYSREDMLKLTEIAKHHDLYIISDEAYEIITYSNIFHTNISTLSKDAFERTISIQSFSKSFCMTGFRIGYMIAPKNIINAVNKLHGHLSGNNCTFAQYGAIAALDMPKETIQKMISELEERRDYAFNLFSKLFSIQRPDGAFYLFLNVGQYIEAGHFENCNNMAEYILQEASVALLPGSVFGMENFLRVSFASTMTDITNAFKQIEVALCKLD